MFPFDLRFDHSDTLIFLVAENRLFPTEVRIGGFQAKEKRLLSLIHKEINLNLTLDNTQSRAKSSLQKLEKLAFLSES